MKQTYRQKSRRKAQRGSAIVAALWVCMALAVLIGSMIFTGQTDVAVVRHARDQAILDAALQGGLNLSLARLNTLRDTLGITAPTNRQHYRVGEVDVSVVVSDEAGRIDVNAAPRELLRMLFKGVDATEDKADVLADQVLDWRDRDDTRRRNGAEREDYIRLGRRHGPTNGPMRSINELAMLRDMTDAVFDKLVPLVTVFSQQRGFDPSLSPPKLIQAFSNLEPAQAGAHRYSSIQLAAAARKYVNYSRRLVFRFVASASYRGLRGTKSQIVAINPYKQSFRILASKSR